MNWPWRELAPCPCREFRLSARRAAPGAGTHLVDEHRRDPGVDGLDQPTLTARISGKSQP
jgi:hypothetical protein